jgi:sugar fermentation stimulation protein A
VSPLALFGHIRKARFLSRPNRFLMQCELDGIPVEAFLPNPGRLLELLLPDSTVYLTTDEPTEKRRTSFTVVAVERENRLIMLHTHRTNDVARYLVEKGKVPGLEGARIIRAEVPVDHSRFDFLLEDETGPIYLEVKSCTLVGENVAMFPDAVTARGARHLGELKELSQKGLRTAVLFIVHWPCARLFMPDYHTDLHFARSLLDVRHDVKVIPVAVKWRDDLTLDEEVKLLSIPWEFIEKEARDGGSYLLILRVSEGLRISVGGLGDTFFRKGYYVYVGSAMTNLSKRIERHLRLRKLHHWHIDELRAVSDVRAALAIRSSERLECAVADAVSSIADWRVSGFGSSDCSCPTHLFGFGRDPLESGTFHKLLQFFRMDRCAEQANS